jgi:hypothetical protein
MLVWALRTFGQITLRTVDRWQSTGQPIADRVVPLGFAPSWTAADGAIDVAVARRKLGL